MPARAEGRRWKSEKPDPLKGDDAQAIRRSILEHLQFTLAELPKHVDSKWEPYVSLALAVLTFAVLWLAGFHAAAALFHHFVLRDSVLLSMLPRRWRGARR